jgi:UDP-glucuronate 4-epimerase
VNVLVTGGAGFIGSHVVERLAARGDRVCVIDDLSGECARPPTLADVRFVHGDVRDADLLRRVFRSPGAPARNGRAGAFDAVVHLAALVGVRPSLTDAARYRDVNVDGTRTLLRHVEEHTRVVFASSSSVYGSSTTGPSRESDPAAPASPYATTKRDAEAVCAEHHERVGSPMTSLRFFTVYGPGQRPDMAISRFVRCCLAGEPIPFYGDGSSSRDYTWVSDLVDGVVAAIDRTHPGASTHNLGSGRPVTLMELVEAVAAATGSWPEIDRLPEQPGDVPHTHADISSAKRELGYAPVTTLEQGLRRYLEWLGGRVAATSTRQAAGRMTR